MCGFVPRHARDEYSSEHIPSLRKLEQFDQVATGLKPVSTRGCCCEDKQGCSHPWELSDEGAGTIVKSGGKMYWGHKASVLGFPRQGYPWMRVR